MLTRKASAVVAEGGNQDTARLTTGSQGLRAIGGGNPIPIALLDRRATPVPGMPTGAAARLRSAFHFDVCCSVFGVAAMLVSSTKELMTQG